MKGTRYNLNWVIHFTTCFLSIVSYSQYQHLLTFSYAGKGWFRMEMLTVDATSWHWYILIGLWSWGWKMHKNGRQIRDKTLIFAKHWTGKLSVAKITQNLSVSYNFRWFPSQNRISWKNFRKILGVWMSKHWGLIFEGSNLASLFRWGSSHYRSQWQNKTGLLWKFFFGYRIIQLAMI